MSRTIELPHYAAIPAILALAGVAFVMKPEEMRRDPVLETQAIFGMAAKYEVMYARCIEERDEAGLNAASMTSSFVGGFSQQFPARSDEDAARFVLTVRPQCDVASLYRLDGRVAGQNRYRRIRIEVPGATLSSA